MGPGEEIICKDNQGRAFVTKIESVGEKSIHVKIISEWTGGAELPVNIIAAQALIKGEKMDTVVQKATELGAAAIYFYEGDHSVVKWDANKRQKKIDRLNRIAKEAAEQSERMYIPEVVYFSSARKVIEGTASIENRVVLSEAEARTEQPAKLPDVFSRRPETLLAFIGPEGGFSRNEIALFEEQSIPSTSLGKRIVRSETASLLLLGAVTYYYEIQEGNIQ
jgi:16S rRNA (uracil1498-N3)-methyltransferase